MALGKIASVDLNINDKARTGSFAGDTIDVYLAGFNAEFNEFGNSESFSLDNYMESYGPNIQRLTEDMQQSVKFGEFIFGVMSHEVFLNLPLLFFERLEDSFGVTSWRKNDGVIDKGDSYSGESYDYWFFARRGDFSFVPREELVRRSGKDYKITLETSLVEQIGEDNSLLTPVSYAGKVAGKSSPKAHRLFRRFPKNKKAPLLAPRSLVSQKDYNLISQPDLEGIKIYSGEIFKDLFARPQKHNTQLGNDWLLASSAVSGANKSAGVRIFDKHVVLGPSPLVTSVFNDLNGIADESDWKEKDPNSLSVYKSIAEKDSFLLRGTFKLPIGSRHDSPLYVNAFKNQEKPRATEGYGFAVLPGAENNILLTDGHKIESNTDRKNWPLPSASFKIERGIEYEFICIYGTGDASRNSVDLSLWIWPDEGVRSNEPVIKSAAKVPLNVQDDLVGRRNHVGFGTNRLKEGYWIVGEFEARNTKESYSQALMELDVTGQRGEINLIVTARGQGANDQRGIINGHSLYIWNHSSEKWNLLQSPSYESYKAYTHSVDIELLPKYVNNGRIMVLASTNERHLQTLNNSIESKLTIDYVYGRSVPVERKTYGKTDFYFRQNPDTNANERGLTSYRPSQEVKFNVNNISSMNVLSIDPSTAEGLSAPIEEILEVVVLDENGQELVSLDEGVEYRYFWQNESLRGSMRESIALIVQRSFSGQDIRVRARVHSMTRLLDEYVQNTPQRKIDGDILPMHKQSVFVDVFGKNKGGATGLEEALREWIFNHDDDEINASEVVRFLGNKGAENILLYDGSDKSNALRLNARRIDKNGNEQTESSFTLLKKEVTETFVPGTIRIIST